MSPFNSCSRLSSSQVLNNSAGDCQGDGELFTLRKGNWNACNFFFYMLQIRRERESDRQTDRHRRRQRQRDRQRGRQRDRDRDIETETERQRQRDSQRERERKKKKKSTTLHRHRLDRLYSCCKEINSFHSNPTEKKAPHGRGVPCGKIRSRACMARPTRKPNFPRCAVHVMGKCNCRTGCASPCQLRNRN